jgi:hypothetical protein
VVVVLWSPLARDFKSRGVKASVKRVGFPLRVRRIHLQQPRKIFVNLRVILADDHPFVLLRVRAELERHAGVTIVGEPGVGTRMAVHLTMPVASQRYSTSGLRGKRAVVATGDARVAQALVHFGEAL